MRSLHTRHRTKCWAISFIAAAFAALPVFAQASFGEGFNGKTVADLEAEGWMFRNQSTPLGPLGWRPDDLTDPYEGTDYLVTDGYCLSGSGAGRTGSNWALLPAIPDQIAGDELRFFLAEGWSLVRDDVMQVRYSPTGGTSTGTDANSVGDFTVLLAEFPHDTIGWWNEHAISLPGSGRIAFRYYVPGGRCASMYVDGVTVGTPPGSGIPLPDDGETVHWDMSISPVVVDDGILNVVAGGTIVVDPGVAVQISNNSTVNNGGTIEFMEGATIDIAQGSSLTIIDGGTAIFAGTAANPITLSGSQIFLAPGLKVFANSTMTMNYVNADIFAWVSSGSVATVDNSTFTTTSASANDAAGFRLFHGTMALRNSTITDGGLVEEGSYLLLDAVTLENSQAQLLRDDSPQPVYLNNLVARDNQTDAPFVIHNFDAFFGPDNTIENNLYPVRLDTGGVLPGSTIASAGNTNNYIAGLARVGSRSTWANVGMPYVLDWDDDIPPGGGRLTIEPGVTAQFKRGINTNSDAFPIEFFVDLVCRGLPDAPITLEAFDANAGWGGLFFGDNSAKRPKLEYTVVRQADTGAVTQLSPLWLENSLFANNDRGAQSNSFGRVISRGTRFDSNGVAVQTSAGSGGVGLNAGQADLFGLTNPNSFVNNSAGVQILNPTITQVDARYNWWGDATGPQHPDNPAGQGDSATTGATVVPFRTVAPNVDDHPPIVSFKPMYAVLEEGTKVILHWDVEEDQQIVTQRLEYTPHGLNPPLSTFVDNIAPNVRSLEVVVPQSPPSSNNLDPVFRIVVVDDAGQEGWDEVTFFTPYEDSLTPFTVSPMPAVMHPGEQADVCWSEDFGDATLMIDDMNYAISLGGTTVNCLSLGLRAPAVSTDLARIVVSRLEGAGGRVGVEYSPYFSIRPDSLIGDAPPTVEMLTPAAGASFVGGSIVPITWVASDDEALRSIDVQASYDGGRGWHWIAKDLPGDTTLFQWQLPESTGIADVRVRVLARDLRFQVSSDGTDRVFAVTAGGVNLLGDMNCDGLISVSDIGPFVVALTDPTGYGAQFPNCNINHGDVNQDGTVSVSDIGAFVSLLTQ